MKAPPKVPLALFVALLGISCSAPLVKLASAPPAVIAAYRMLFAALPLLAVVAARRRDELRALRRPDVLACTVSGIFLAFHFISWFSSLNYTSVASSVTLATLQPLFAFVLGYLLFGERLAWRAIAGVMFSIAGGIVIGAGDFEASGRALLGDGLALLGAALATAYLFAGYRARQHLSLNVYTGLVYTSAAVTLLIYCAALSRPLAGYPGLDWGVFVLLAIFPTLLGHSIFNWSMRYVSISVISMVILCEPIGASALAYLLFGTVPRLSQYIGGAGVLLGVFIFMRYRRPSRS